jgi:preprotein translocase subunit SecG
MFLTVITLTLLATQTESKFENLHKILDMSQFSKDKFEDIDYKSFKEMQENLIIHKHLVKEWILEDKYDDLEPKFCGEENCQTSMYEITNHTADNQTLKGLPTVLIIAGIHGTETLGMQSLMQFISFVQKMYHEDLEYYMMLNHVRLLAIPVMNMSGFFNGKDTEFVIVNELEDESDINFDFNVNPRDLCFTTLSARFIQKIYSEYLIYGTLALTKDDFKVRVPEMSRLMGNNELVQDDIILRRFGGQLRSSYLLDIPMKEDSDLWDEDDIFGDSSAIPELFFELHSEFEGVNVDSGEKHVGKYIDWAFIASEEPDLVSLHCLPKNSTIPQKELKPSSLSNRAIAVEIGLTKEGHDGILDVLGNELAFVDADHPDAIPGVIPCMMHVFRKFLQMVNPYAYFTDIDSTTKGSEQQIIFNLHMFGSLNHAPITVVGKGIKDQQVKGTNTEKNALVRISMRSITVNYEGKNMLSEDKPHDFEFDMHIYFDFLDRVEKGTEFVTHYLKVKVDSNYSSTLNKFNLKFPNMRKYTLKNVDLKNLESSLLIELFSAKSIMFPTSNIFLETNGVFPAQLKYDNTKGEVSLKIIEEEYEVPKKRKKADSMIKTGMVNHLNEAGTSRFVTTRVNRLLDREGDVTLKVYQEDMEDYLCRNLRIDTFLEQNESPKEAEVAEHENMLKSQKSTVKILNFFHRLNYFCENFLENDEPDSEKNLLMELSSEKPQIILPNLFFGFLKKKAKLEFETKMIEKTEKKEMDKGTTETTETTETTTQQLSGTIVYVDPSLMSSTDSGKASKILNPQEILGKKENTYLPLNFRNLSCSSINLDFTLDSEMLTKIAEDSKGHPTPPDFFYLSVQKDINVHNEIDLYLYTNAKSNTNDYILKNQLKSFTLSKEREDYKVDGPGNQTFHLKRFHTETTLEDLKLLGQYTMVFEKGKEKNVFDCFFSPNPIGKNEAAFYYLIYMGIHQEVKLIAKKMGFGAKQLFGGNLKWICFMLLGLFLTGFIILFVLMKKPSKEEVQNEEEKEEPKEKKGNEEVEQEKQIEGNDQV